MIRLIVVFSFLVILTGCGVTFGGGATPTQTPAPAPPVAATATPVLPASQELERLRQEIQRLQDQLRQQQQPGPAAGPGETARWDDQRKVWVIERAPQPAQQPAQPGQLQTQTVQHQAGVWPDGCGNAGQVFGVPDSFWEPTAQGVGCHMRERPDAVVVDPKGHIMEGYRDTRPGRDPVQFVSNGDQVRAQGVTVWRTTDQKGQAVTAEIVFCQMFHQKFGRHGIGYDTGRGAIEAMGFSKPINCADGEPRTAGAPAPSGPKS